MKELNFVKGTKEIGQICAKSGQILFEIAKIVRHTNIVILSDNMNVGWWLDT